MPSPVKRELSPGKPPAQGYACLVVVNGSLMKLLLYLFDYMVGVVTTLGIPTPGAVLPVMCMAYVL
jgi:hypothetical protein